jgi:hypothetical protein
MQRVKFAWSAFKNVALLFSFIVNLTLLITVLVLLTLIFQIKNGIAQPLIDGLHSSFVGLDEATIDRIIPVRDEIPIAFTLPLEQNTNVVLTQPVPLSVNATFDLPGGGGRINGVVAINLPQGLQLPVALDLDVPVETTVPVSLDVRAVIPLRETQLHDAFDNLRGLLEPFVRALDNLPGNAEEGWAYLGLVLSGQGPDLLNPTYGSEHPWPGFSRTAGDDYGWPLDTPPQPGELTGIQPGGLGAWIAPEGASDGVYEPVYENGVPLDPFTGRPVGEPAIPAADATPSGDLGIIPITPVQ